MAEPILQVDELHTHFSLRSGVLKAVDGVSFSLEEGEVLCVVGESGSGKTVTALSVMGLIDPPGRIVSGRVLFRGQDLRTLSEKQMQKIRGDRIAMIFQDPMQSLNPSFKIGDQIAEGMILHLGLRRDAARARVLELLNIVGIAQPEVRYGDYPHQFSGGMRQRVMIASAIACRPDVLIADEPTTALDVTIQAQILNLLADLRRELNSAMLLITHDLGVVAEMADKVMVMYAGRAVEYGDVQTIFHRPQHPYTRGLLDSLIRLEDDKDSQLRPIPGTPPDVMSMPPGCSFRPRCGHAIERCAAEAPALRPSPEGHPVACHRIDAETRLDTGEQTP